MKKCPFCDEEIQDDAVKCLFCKELLLPRKKEKGAGPWYFSLSALVLGFLAVGPFILPLLWVNPRISARAKVIGSVIIIIFSIALVVILQESFISIKKYMDMLQGVY
jgi:hypothetical protein